MKSFVFVFLGLLLLSQSAAADMNWRCFQSVDTPKSIRLAFAYPVAGDADAFVQYEKGRVSIALEIIDEAVTPMVEGRPEQYRVQFAERFGEELGGIYEVIFQGAVFYQFSYTAKDQQTVDRFENDPFAEQGKHCVWQKP